MTPQRFAGFATGTRATVIPNAFFSVLLPAIEDPAELLVTLYAFYALGRRSGTPRAVSTSALAAEAALMRALAPLPDGAAAALQRGLSLAIERGSLLIVKRQADSGALIALNTAMARRAAAAQGLPAADLSAGLREADETLSVAMEPSGAFSLYEENIGSVPPLLMDEIDEAERLYPPAWIEAAFREAVANNRRNWRYIVRILERWKLEGPNYETAGRHPSGSPIGRRRTIGGPYRRVVERGQRPNG